MPKTSLILSNPNSMNFYRDQITQKSWQILRSLSSRYQFTLIGGWAVWLYTHQLKSKDIDIVVEFDQLEKLRRDYSLFKNDRLKKYEVAQDEIQIDVYVPHYSKLGIPAEQLLSRFQSTEGFHLPIPEDLLLLKHTAFLGRAGSAKGRKDLLDIISLLKLPYLNWSLIPKSILNPVVKETNVPELNLNNHQFSRLKKSWLSHYLDKLS
ncbi:MAG: Uncharacterized protein G01um101416_962 [Microgenomates group bacterium Gr01-1014_16]|nr:MAG: Uncharacterized protein G01um101416_962 [Microgenomates group bacterium Gr01-1014_16]